MLEELRAKPLMYYFLNLFSYSLHIDCISTSPGTVADFFAFPQRFPVKPGFDQQNGSPAVGDAQEKPISRPTRNREWGRLISLWRCGCMVHSSSPFLAGCGPRRSNAVCMKPPREPSLELKKDEPLRSTTMCICSSGRMERRLFSWIFQAPSIL